MSLILQGENACCTWLYHQSARLIKSVSLFAVVVTGAAWSGEIIFLHALLTLFPFSSFTRLLFFLFVSLFSLHKPPNSPVSLAAVFIVVFQTPSLCLLMWLQTLSHLTFSPFHPNSNSLQYCTPHTCTSHTLTHTHTPSQSAHVWPFAH